MSRLSTGNIRGATNSCPAASPDLSQVNTITAAALARPAAGDRRSRQRPPQCGGLSFSGRRPHGPRRTPCLQGGWNALSTSPGGAKRRSEGVHASPIVRRGPPGGQEGASGGPCCPPSSPPGKSGVGRRGEMDPRTGGASAVRWHGCRLCPPTPPGARAATPSAGPSCRQGLACRGPDGRWRPLSLGGPALTPSNRPAAPRPRHHTGVCSRGDGP